MSAAAALAGLRVLVTRPERQAEKLARLIEQAGGKAVRLPLLSIVPAPPTPHIQRVLNDAHVFDWWIFTSANAVRYARELDRGAWPVRLAAIGPATAASLEAEGLPALAPVASSSSEALLALPEFAEVDEQSILIVTGAGGLDQLAPALRARGARVEIAEVYRRVPLPYDEARVVAALRGTDVIVITSGEALQHLYGLTPEASRAGLLKKHLVAPSARVVEHASQLGFSMAVAVEQMSDAGLLQALETIAKKTT
ncbi:MAG TPA: uroporphyrinogen-III synthase [Nevskiaceae bacterium]|nr:uroporphyrinogen-III synthase [Nevskiaceae bacterium]